jgi:DNA-binding NarL/FixJ family response regulator
MLKILLVDDHDKYRNGVNRILSEDPDIRVTGEASNGKEALRMIKKHNYDVIVLDITLPDIDGIEILKQILTFKLKAHVLMLSIHPQKIYAAQALKTGATGYLTKSRAPRELISAIKTVAEGKAYF